MSRTPLCQVAFTMHRERTTGFALPGVDTETLTATSRVSRFDLTLQLREAGDGSVTGTLEYSTALYDRTTVERMARHLERLLASAGGRPRPAPVPPGHARRRRPRRAAARGPHLRRAHPLRPPTRRGTAPPPPPDAVAVVCGTESLTYAELNTSANRLTHHLRSLGAAPRPPRRRRPRPRPAPGARPARRPPSGAGYLPLDPEHPADRIAYTPPRRGRRPRRHLHGSTPPTCATPPRAGSSSSTTPRRPPRWPPPPDTTRNPAPPPAT
ncbi:hypothetical protein LV779_13640 [Streptomyces thinghirensis]|nr:hypothetical protein [Streptomyces thinghirensis]